MIQLRFNTLQLFKISAGSDHVLYVGITCGMSAPYVAGQLDHCMDNLDKFTPVLLGFNPTYLSRYMMLIEINMNR